jgi:vitamin B12 transporter
MKLSLSFSKCVCLLAFLFSFSYSTAYGQYKQLEEIFVTANRIGEPLATVTNDVDVLDKNDLNKLGNVNLIQALGRLPGVQTIGYGNHSVYMRGAESRMTSLYIEGIRIESQDGVRLGGGVPWEMLPLEMVERIEVVKGPASTMYGSDAMGGVVQLFGKKAGSEDRPTLTQAFGTHGTRKTTGLLSGKRDAVDYSLVLSTKSSDGYDTRPDLTHTPSKEASNSHVAMLKLGYDFNPVHRLEAVSFKSKQFSQWAPTYTDNIDITKHNTVTANGLQWMAGWSDNQVSRFKINQSILGADSDAANAGNDLAWNYKTTTQNFSFDHEAVTTAGQFSGVFEFKKDQFKAAENDYSGYLANTAVNASRNLYAAGLGYKFNYQLHTINTSIRTDDYSGYVSHNSYSLAYAYQIKPAWKISVSQSTGFRVPTLEMLNGYYGNANLVAESNVSKEMALQYANGKSSARVTLFQNDISHLLTSATAQTDCTAAMFCYYNLDGNVKIQGIGLAGKTEFQGFNLQSHLDLLNPVNQTTGKQLSLRSKQNFKFAVDKPFESTRVGLEYQFIGKRFDDASNTLELPKVGLLNVWTQTSINNEWQWINRIDNLMNKSYQQYGCTSGGVNTCRYAMPGTTFFTAIQWQPK